jgi:ribosome biogenesis protein ENP2
MIYNPFTCDLLVSASSNEIYRLSLDEGVFLSSFSSLCTGISALAFNKHLNLLITGGNNGIVEYWDYRMRYMLFAIYL